MGDYHAPSSTNFISAVVLTMLYSLVSLNNGIHSDKCPWKCFLHCVNMVEWTHRTWNITGPYILKEPLMDMQSLLTDMLLWSTWLWVTLLTPVLGFPSSLWLAFSGFSEDSSSSRLCIHYIHYIHHLHWILRSFSLLPLWTFSYNIQFVTSITQDL